MPSWHCGLLQQKHVPPQTPALGCKAAQLRGCCLDNVELCDSPVPQLVMSRPLLQLEGEGTAWNRMVPLC